MITIAVVGYTLYDKLEQKLKYELYNQEIEFSCIFTLEPMIYKKIGNIPVSSIFELQYNNSFDYVCIADNVSYAEYYRYVNEYFEAEKIISADTIINYDGFDFMRYLDILRSKISIISDTCWGGMLSHSLNLQFKSPLVNTYVAPKDYLELISNIKYYFNCPLELYQDRNAFTPPIGILGDKVKIGLNHYVDFYEGQREWNKRVSRVNYDNILVQMSCFENEEQVIRFSENKESYKVGFCQKKIDLPGVYYLCQYRDTYVQERMDFTEYVQNIVKARPSVYRPINVFKMLLHEDDFIRVNE